MKSFLALFLFLQLSPGLSFTQESVSQAMKLIESKDYPGARKILEAIISRDERNAEARFRLGVLLTNQFRDYDAAEEQLERAVELADNDAEYHFVLGNIYGIQAQIANIFSKITYAGKVKTQFVRAVDLAPKDVRYRFALMTYYLMAPGIVGGSVTRATEQAEALLGLDSSEGHIAYAQIASYEKDEAEAEKQYKYAIAVNPLKPRPYNLLGYFYMRQKRVQDAIAQFRSYVRCAPDDPNSYDSLGEGLFEGGIIDESLQNYTKALSLNPRFAPSVFGKARCLEAKGKKDEAIVEYKRFLELNTQGANVDIAKQRVKALSE